jgi:Concanavalin A-like lectin/glucanases superfamily
MTNRKTLSIAVVFLALTVACDDRSLPSEVLSPTVMRPASTAINLPSGAVAHYPLNASLSEATDPALNGTEVGSLGGAPDRRGAVNGATAFDGDSSWAILPGSPTDNAEALTISVWLKRAPGNDSDRCGRPDLASSQFSCQHNIFAKSAGVGDPEMRGQFLGVPVDAVYFMTHYNQYAFSIALAATLSNWHMYTFVWGGGQSQVFVDGLRLAEAAAPTSPAGVGDFYLGHNGHPTLGIRERFEGVMDDLYVFRRQLGEDEICSLFLPTVGTRRVLARGRLVRNGITYSDAFVTYDQQLDNSDAGSNPGIELWADSSLTRRLERSNDNNGQWDYSPAGAYFENGAVVVFGTRTGSHGPQQRTWTSSGSYFLTQSAGFNIPANYQRCARG